MKRVASPLDEAHPPRAIKQRFNNHLLHIIGNSGRDDGLKLIRTKFPREFSLALLRLAPDPRHMAKGILLMLDAKFRRDTILTLLGGSMNPYYTALGAVRMAKAGFSHQVTRITLFGSPDPYHMAWGSALMVKAKFTHEQVIAVLSGTSIPFEIARKALTLLEGPPGVTHENIVWRLCAPVRALFDAWVEVATTAVELSLIPDSTQMVMVYAQPTFYELRMKMCEPSWVSLEEEEASSASDEEEADETSDEAL